MGSSSPRRKTQPPDTSGQTLPPAAPEKLLKVHSRENSKLGAANRQTMVSTMDVAKIR
ncbi:hypothetical protein D9M71_625930 [compost metagenome]